MGVHEESDIYACLVCARVCACVAVDIDMEYVNIESAQDCVAIALDSGNMGWDVDVSNYWVLSH